MKLIPLVERWSTGMLTWWLRDVPLKEEPIPKNISLHNMLVNHHLCQSKCLNSMKKPCDRIVMKNICIQ